MGELAEFNENRPRLFGLAYRMLGEATEAEDVLQDAYLRWAASGPVDVPAAWLTKVVTNLCLSRLGSARARQEKYVGPWLPEPVFTGDGLLGQRPRRAAPPGAGRAHPRRRPVPAPRRPRPYARRVRPSDGEPIGLIGLIETAGVVPCARWPSVAWGSGSSRTGARPPSPRPARPARR